MLVLPTAAQKQLQQSKKHTNNSVAKNPLHVDRTKQVKKDTQNNKNINQISNQDILKSNSRSFTDVPYLQKTIGNQAVQRLLKTGNLLNSQKTANDKTPSTFAVNKGIDNNAKINSDSSINSQTIVHEDKKSVEHVSLPILSPPSMIQSLLPLPPSPLPSSYFVGRNIPNQTNKMVSAEPLSPILKSISIIKDSERMKQKPFQEIKTVQPTTTTTTTTTTIANKTPTVVIPPTISTAAVTNANTLTSNIISSITSPIVAKSGQIKEGKEDKDHKVKLLSEDSKFKAKKGEKELQSPVKTQKAAITESTQKTKIKKSPSSPQEDPAFIAVIHKARAVAEIQGHNNPAQKKAAEAQAAAKSPPNDVKSQAAEVQVKEMDKQEPNSFDSIGFEDALVAEIEKISIKSQKDIVEFKQNDKAATIKTAAKSKLTQEKEATQGPIKLITEQPLNESNLKPKESIDLPTVDAGPKPPEIGAEEAAPKPKPEEEVSLAEESHSLDEQMQKSNITEDQLKNSNEPQFQEALSKKNEAQTKAVQDSLSYRQDEAKTLSVAKTQVLTFAQTSIHGMHDIRKDKFGKIGEDQTTTKTEDERRLADHSAIIEKIYNETKESVKNSLDAIESEINPIFDSGAEQAKQHFENYVDNKIWEYKVERYVGLDGPALWLYDLASEPRKEVNDIYIMGKGEYIKKMKVVIQNIANVVEKRLKEAKTAISQGKIKVQQEVDKLPDNLKKSGQEAANKIQGKFDTLRQSVDDKRDQLVESLSKKYVDNLQKIDERINQMKEENRSFINKAVDSIKEVYNTILEIKNMLLGVLSRAAAAMDKIIANPIRFLDNLVAGVKKGLDNFVNNIGMHLQKGLMDWLFGTLAKAGITMPKSFDLKGILSLVLQVLGLTYPNIRKRAVGILGEKTVKILETAAEIFKIMITQGPAGLWEYVKEKLGDLKETVIEGIKSFLKESVIVAGIKWIIGLLNPASAFVKAAMAIYDIVMFFVNKGSQIVSLVNAIIDSISAIADGTIGVASAAVENALAKAVPVVIGFLASLLGLGGLDKKIKKIIEMIQEPINEAIDWVIKKAVEIVKAIGKALGFGKEDKNKDKELDPKEAATNKIIERLGNETEISEAKHTISEIETELKPIGLISLKIDPKENDDNEDISIFAEASAKKLAGLLRREGKRITVATHAIVVLKQDKDILELIKEKRSFSVDNKKITEEDKKKYGITGEYLNLEANNPSWVSKNKQQEATSTLLKREKKNELSFVATNTGTRIHNLSHSEHQFTSWFFDNFGEGKSNKYNEIASIYVQVQGRPHCTTCCEDLTNLRKRVLEANPTAPAQITFDPEIETDCNKKRKDNVKARKP